MDIENCKIVINSLQSYGFQKLTTWEIRKDKIKPATTDWDNCAGWIYAYVAEGKLRYLGITTSVLRSRLDGYSYQVNDRVGQKILNLLQRNVEVEIYGVKRSEVEQLDLEEEESRLIRELDPDWNIRA